MSKLKDLVKSPHIQIALATGFCIIVLAYFSRRILSEPLSYLSLALPPFIAFIFETLLGKYQESKFLKTWYWIVAVFVSTALVILFHII
jgi:hypothetical protein